MAAPCLLAGDIGGTNARFALDNVKKPGFALYAAVSAGGHYIWR